MSKGRRRPAKRRDTLPGPLERLSVPGVERKRRIARVTTRALAHLTSEFVNRGFEWLLPVAFSRSTDPLWPDPGASIEKRIEVEIYDETVRATLSMIIHKMIACSLAHPKLFLLSPNIRIERRERASTGVHTYEFTQLDFEMRGASSGDVRSLVEGALVGLVRTLKERMRPELAYLGHHGDLRVPRIPFDSREKRELVQEYGKGWEALLTAGIRAPIWVTNIPREFYDFEDFETGTWDNYDLFLPGMGEVLSGARRESSHSKIIRKMKRDGVDPRRYALLLRMAKEERLRPSAGAGIGLERLLAWIVGARHIGEVQPFPKIPGLVYDL